MRIVGLTGGIGSGKTTVAKMFGSLGVPVFFADDEAKALYQDIHVLTEVSNILNTKEIIDEDGRLIKSKLAQIIFNDPSKRLALNNFIHPLVKQRFYEWMKHQDFVYCIREAAILIESGAHKDCDAIVVVTSPMENRIHRVMERDGAHEEDVKKRIVAQMSDDERMKFASYVIKNDSDLNDLYQQVLRIHQLLL